MADGERQCMFAAGANGQPAVGAPSCLGKTRFSVGEPAAQSRTPLAEMAETLAETGGHYAQFNGDGLMALYGLEGEFADACYQAVEGATAMFQRLDILNLQLAQELKEPLRMGIGIHSGGAIVGSMGPPQTPIISAIGDNVNVAARLEAQTKELGAALVISAETAERAEIDLAAFDRHEVAVRGRHGKLDVYAVKDPEVLRLNLER